MAKTELPNTKLKMRYWHWFLKGYGSKAGFRYLIWHWYSLVYLLCGSILMVIVPENLSAVANTVLVPVAGIFVGLSFAWIGNAYALLQEKTIDELSKEKPEGLAYYAFQYQNATLAIIATLSLWALAGMKVFDNYWPTTGNAYLYPIAELVLYTALSLTIRECWCIVISCQLLLLSHTKISKIIEEEEQREEDTRRLFRLPKDSG